MKWWNPQVEVENEARWISSFEDDELKACVRFDTHHLRKLMDLLGIPRFLWATWSTRRFNGQEALLLFLRRLVGRETLVHLGGVIYRSPLAILDMYNVIVDHVYRHAMVAMRIELWEEDILAFARELRRKGCLMAHCCGFVGGTMFDICRPTVGQETMYEGWKRKHKTEYQRFVLPNFLIGDWFGPVPERANNVVVMAKSGIMPRL